MPINDRNKYEFEWAKAIAQDDWSDLKQQINNGLNLDRGPIIHTAIQQKRFEIATNLIEHGADINKVNKRGKTPLQILIENHRQNPQRLAKGPGQHHHHHHHVGMNNPAQLNTRGLSGMSSSSSTRPYRRHRGQHHHIGAGDGVEESRENKVMNFARYMMKQGASPINGANEGEDYEKYQEFYKRKTKLTQQDFLRLKKIIEKCDVDGLAEELDNNVTVQCFGPKDAVCQGRGLLHLAILAPCYKIIKLLLAKGACPNAEDRNGATPLYLIFYPIEYKDRMKYKHEKHIPKELLCWHDIGGDCGETQKSMSGGDHHDQLIDQKKPGRNDELVRIGQALLQAGALMVPDHTPELNKRALQENNPNCPLVIFWHLYSKDANESDADAINDPIILNLEKRITISDTTSSPPPPPTSSHQQQQLLQPLTNVNKLRKKL
jgi:hypothetical protein